MQMALLFTMIALCKITKCPECRSRSLPGASEYVQHLLLCLFQFVLHQYDAALDLCIIGL